MKEQEYIEILSNLKHLGIFFYKFFAIGKPIFTKEIPTAGVRFFEGENKNFQFLLNEEFWNSLNQNEKLWIITHELLHVIQLHGVRISKIKNVDFNLANIAADLIVNHKTIDYYGFKKEDIDKGWYWLENIVKEEDIETWKTYSFEEIYFRLLNNKELQDKCKSNHPDEHNFNDKPISKEELEEIIKKNFTQKEIEKLKEEFKNYESNPGKESLSLEKIISEAFVPPKAKWETIIKNWLIKKEEEEDIETWETRTRSHEFFNHDFLIPGEKNKTGKKKEKIDVALFLDTSGSCAHLADRFFNLAKSIPQSKFNLILYCFDTKVYSINLKDRKLYGFGGTSFNIIENELKKLEKYPSAVFIITDGYGNYVNPGFPQRWYWILTENHGLSFIPKDSKKYDLKYFE